MKVAVLILAYRYPLGIPALSRYFPEQYFDLFIHVDAKVDIQPFMSSVQPAAFFLEDRVCIFWRAWTTVEAMIRLLTAAKIRSRYDRFLLLSDDSIPIVEPQTLLRSLEENPNIIQLSSHQKRRWRYDKFFMFDSKATQLRPTVDREVTDDAIERFERLASLKRRGKKPLDVYYEGSQWMVLSAEAVDHILTTWVNDDWLRESFEFSDTPDESYIQTIVGHWGKCRSRILMKVDWSVPSPPRVYRTLADIEVIKPDGELFARKIDLSSKDLDEWLLRLLGASPTLDKKGA